MFGFDRIFGWFSFGSVADISSGSIPGLQDEICTSNPATGLPMVAGCSGVDIEGNPFGMDLQDIWTHSTGWDCSFSDSSSWDSGIGSSWGD